MAELVLSVFPLDMSSNPQTQLPAGDHGGFGGRASPLSPAYRNPGRVQLLRIVQAGDGVGPLLCAAQDRQQQRRQNRNNRNDHEQFDQCETENLRRLWFEIEQQNAF